VSSVELLAIIVRVELLAVCSAAVTIVGHAVWLAWGGAHARERRAAARRAILTAIGSSTAPPDALGSLSALPRREQASLIAELAMSLVGEQRDRLLETADELGLIADAEADCRSRDWSTRLRAAHFLTAVGGGETTVPRLLDDPHVLVRAQAAEWAGGHPTRQNVAKLLDRLADPTDGARLAYRAALSRAREHAVEALAERLAAARDEDAPALLELALGSPDPRLLPGALVCASSPLAATRAGAARLLGALGGREAAAALVDLLGDPEAEVRASAVSAIGALGQWSMVATLSALLHDPSYPVRRTTAAALTGMGAPGLLYLRRASTHPDRRAAEAARQALSMLDAG
jgi:HEAT repeat protein